MINTIKKYATLNGISGHEENVSEALINESNADEILYDNLGSVALYFKGTNSKRKIAVIAHFDEVGMIVSDVTKNGMVKFKLVGGINIYGLTNQRVIINNQYKGTILGTSPHLGNKELSADDLVIDCGFISKDEALNKIKIGQAINFDAPFIDLENDFVCAKALDNRIGVSIVSMLNKFFKDNQPSDDIYLCASVQEEIGLRGANTLMGVLPSDLDEVIVVDVSPVDDYYDENPINRLGDGFLLRIKDPRMVFNYELINKVEDICNNEGFKYQPYFSLGGTDAASVEIAGIGTKVMALCIGGRNIHSANSIVNINDVEELYKFLTFYLG